MSAILQPIPPRLTELLDVATGGQWSQIIGGGDPGPWPYPPVVYGPGRGLWLDAETAAREMERARIAPVELHGAPGVWVVSCGPGGLGRSARLRTGAERPSLHCSSWTNLVLGVLCAAQPELWHHGGNMPQLDDLVELTGRFDYDVEGGGTIKVLAYGDLWRKVSPRRGVYMSPVELWDRRDELGTVTLLSQSTKRKGRKPRYDHHTVLLVRPPGEDLLYRCAADGSKSRGRFSATLMDIEVIDAQAARSLHARQMWRAWTCPRLPETPYCPITLETP